MSMIIERLGMTTGKNQNSGWGKCERWGWGKYGDGGKTKRREWGRGWEWDPNPCYSPTDHELWYYLLTKWGERIVFTFLLITDSIGQHTLKCSSRISRHFCLKARCDYRFISHNAEARDTGSQQNPYQRFHRSGGGELQFESE